MIDFIIIEDNLTYITKYKIIIDKVMMNYDIDYDISIYDKYSNLIDLQLKKDSFKIYIIALSAKKKNLEMIKHIREELDDWQSLIILMVEEEKILEKEDCLFLLDIISKTKNYEKSLKRAIQISLKNYDQRPNTLKYCYKKTLYNIEYWKILYIEKVPDSRLCKIKTIEKNYYIQGGLQKQEKLLDNRFLKCSRSHIINLEQIESYNPKTNIITFKNNEQIDAISRNKKKYIIEYLRGIEK